MAPALAATRALLSCDCATATTGHALAAASSKAAQAFGLIIAIPRFVARVLAHVAPRLITRVMAGVGKAPAVGLATRLASMIIRCA
jgi:hypothetical protein